MGKVMVEVYGFQGEGRTMKEARAAAQEKARVALSGSYTPHLVAWRGSVALVWREPESGWVYRIVRSDGEPIKSGDVWGCSCRGEDRKAVIQGAAFHLAQNEWVNTDGVTVPPIVPEDRRREFLDTVRFRLRFLLYFHRAPGTSAGDNAAHDWVCGGPMGVKLPDGDFPAWWNHSLTSWVLNGGAAQAA
jgi:hypothetical protein